MTTPAGWHPDPEGTGQLRWWDGHHWTSAVQPNPQPHTPPPAPIKTPPTPEQKRRNYIIVGVAVALIVGFIGVNAWNGTKDNGDNAAQAAPTTTSETTATPTTTQPSRSAAPSATAAEQDIAEYWQRVDRDGYITLNVWGSYTASQLEAAFMDVRKRYISIKESGGWFVSIDCGKGMNAEGGGRLANGKFALDSLGAAQTGLSVNGFEFEMLDFPAKCPLVEAPTNAVSAQDVVDAVLAAGLPARDPRNNTASCAEAGCVQLVTTDDFSVYQFLEVEAASRYAAIFPLQYQVGVLFMRFTHDGDEPTDPALIPQYSAILDQVAG